MLRRAFNHALQIRRLQSNALNLATLAGLHVTLSCPLMDVSAALSRVWLRSAFVVYPMLLVIIFTALCALNAASLAFIMSCCAATAAFLACSAAFTAASSAALAMEIPAYRKSDSFVVSNRHTPNCKNVVQEKEL